ncbi:MAG: divalent metal cation transporter [Planctomycetaceae bacterium]|nr:MAG: divalent metal cation transporter [Planctomycetaceae bacterium]
MSESLDPTPGSGPGGADSANTDGAGNAVDGVGGAGSAPRAKWYKRVGPGLITACVVIGPGSITTSSQVGARYGYSMLWVVVLSVMLMLTFMTMAARLGVVTGVSSGTLITRQSRRWLAAVLSCSVFFISAAFQFGNNLGIYAAMAEFESALTPVPGLQLWHLVVLFNALAISFLFVFHNLYKAVERLMMAFVGVMLISFAINLAFSRPNPLDILYGMIPPIWTLWGAGEGAEIDLSLLGLVGTTLVMSGAYFQAYLVRQKGWTKRDLGDGLLDARVGAVLMMLITLMLISTAAGALPGEQINDARDIAKGLTIFGTFGRAVFCIGLFSAAYSSFLVNSMVGGFVLSDGFGWGSDPRKLAPRLATTGVLLIGMIVALITIASGTRPMAAIVFGQAVTVLASPAVAAVLLWLCNKRDVMGEDRNGWGLNLLGGVGLITLLAMAYYTATSKVWPEVAKWVGLDG